MGSNELSDQLGEDGYNSESLFIGTSSPATSNDPGDVLITNVAEAQIFGLWNRRFERLLLESASH